MKLNEKQAEKLLQAAMVLMDCSFDAPNGIQSTRFENLARELSQILDDYS